MIGRLYIDGNDAYKQYGVYVTEGGWNELVAYPPLKPVAVNDWHEEDGVEVDLSSPNLNSRDVAIKLAISRGHERFNDLIRLLSDGVYHTFECSYIQRSYKLRLVSFTNLSVAKALGVATIKLADDFPLFGYEYAPPQSSTPLKPYYTIDGIPFSNYGVHILEGTLDDILTPPSVKLNLLRNIGAQAGAIYDGKSVSYSSKEVKIYCLMRAGTIDELWRNYDALLYDLIRPGVRVLGVGEKTFDFYYKSCGVSEFYPDGKIWLRFTLCLVFTTWGK